MDERAPGGILGRYWFLLAIIAMFAAAVALELHHFVATPFLAHRIRSAETAQEEYEALCQANYWFHQGLAPSYSLHTLDTDGVEFRPWQTGGYDRVGTVTIQWTTGASVTRELLDTKPMGCLMGE